MKSLVCIGDSHASFFSGEDKVQPQYPEPSQNHIPYLAGIRLGAVLAYSLHREHTQNQGREKLFEILSRTDPAATDIILCFGEIDCRFHLLRQAESRPPLEAVVADCADKYFQVIMEVRRLGFQVMVWNATPTSYTETNPEYPNHGTHLQRNNCTRLFNRLVAERCEREQIRFIDIFDHLVDKRNYTKEYYLFDGVHLGQLAMAHFARLIRQQYPHIQPPGTERIDWYYRLAATYAKWRYTGLRDTAKLKLKRFLSTIHILPAHEHN